MENKWEKKWVEDIEYLKEELKKMHKNLFAYTEEESFNEKIENLKSMVNELDYEEMKVEISRVVASLKDAHTSLIFPAKMFIPLKFYCFNDGVYIINTCKGYENLLFKKVLALGDMKIEEVLEELSNIISFENEYFFKAQSMKYMQIAEVLYGLLIIDTMDKIKITLDDGEYEVLTCSFEDLVYTNKRLPMYAKNDSENLWFQILKSGELYIKYNSCREQGEESIVKKIENIICLIEKENIEKVTVDLRNNLGGDSTLFTPLIDYLKYNKKINKKENLKVIIGRETFSSALLNAYTFKNSTNAKIIGEPSGGKPNCYGEILRLILPNSKLLITYSTRFYKLIEDDSVMALYPEEILLESIEDYINV
ncbi:peptidase S41 [Clostridium perfringens]|nr:peptidase S41 [Clostridium perfringens]HEO1700920.1 peptidase S41 [Clostridium perfringens]